MTTTCMRNSVVGDAWIYQTAQATPIQRVLDEKGQPTGEILTGPVRLAFPSIFELPPKSDDIDNPKYGTMALFHPWYEQFGGHILNEEYYAACGRKFPNYYDAATQTYNGLYSPFRQQNEKLKFGGFTPGLMFMTCNSKFKPPVVDVRGNPITEPARVYPGVWAILSVNAYPFDDKRKKGVAFGLQAVMIIGDDEPLGGKPVDANKSFAAAKGMVNAPIVPPDIARNMPSAQTPAAPPQIAPHGMPTGYAPPAPPASIYAAPAAPSVPPPMPSVVPPVPQADDDAWMRG